MLQWPLRSNLVVGVNAVAMEAYKLRMNSLTGNAFQRLAVICLMSSMAAPLPGQQAPMVDVPGGSIRGAISPAGAVFKGIPFAEPPVGELRWREPQPVKPWRGVRDATNYSAACVQNPIGSGAFIGRLARRYGVNYAAPPWNLSEDCLYLNIWTPEWPVKEPRAVMFWLHGGSNRLGSGTESGYDGTELAKHGVILVTINYRLGALGFFAHPELSGESPHHSSGNYGLLDQIAALRWVHENIAQFGGDPSRVTVFGESAGGIDAGMLMCSRLTIGLFQRVIVESGPVLGLAYPRSLKDGEHFGELLAEAALKSHRAGSSIKRLRALPAQTILRAASEAAKHELDPGFVLDSWVLARTPSEVFAAAAQQPARLIIGNNGREASVFRGSPSGAMVSVEGPKKTARICYGNLAPFVLALYAIDTRAGRTAAADGWMNDALVTCPSLVMATLNVAAGHPSFVYQFRRSIPGKGQDDLGSFHSLELPFVFKAFNNPVWTWLSFGKQDYMLADTMQSYWTNFAKTGDPNGGGLPQWRPFSEKSGDYIEFGDDGRAAPRQGVRPALCDLDVSKLKQRLIENQ